jgi:tetratricopeptide (TPR) repeat protein
MRPDVHPQVEAGLRDSFPDLMAGEELERAIDRFFSAEPHLLCMAVRPDLPPEENASEERASTLDVYRGVAGILNDICPRVQGVWGVAQDDILTVTFNPQDDRNHRARAMRLQQTARRKLGITITVGIALYPTLNYQIREILQCACKALAHAAFFGHQSNAVFDAVSLNISGDQFYEKGDLAGAVNEFKHALALDPENVNVYNSLGVCYALMDDHDAALQTFQDALVIDKSEYMARYNAGLIHLLRGDRQQALDHFLLANGSRSGIYEVVFQIGKLYMETGRQQLGIDYLEKASRINPDGGLSFRYLAEAYAAAGQTDKATSMYKKAVKTNPNDAVALSSLGCLFDEQGENPEISLVFCEESVRRAPENGLFRYRLGKLYAKQNRREDALKELEKARLLGYEPAGAEIRNIQKGLSAEAN